MAKMLPYIVYCLVRSLVRPLRLEPGLRHIPVAHDHSLKRHMVPLGGPLPLARLGSPESCNFPCRNLLGKF